MNALLNDQYEPEESPGRYVAIYLRAVSVILLVLGLMRAAAILGIGTDVGFTSLDPSRQAGAVTLVALDLFAATGLWLAAAWGPVIWAVAVIVEIAMHTVFSHRFGANGLAVAGHVLLISVFGALRLFGWWRERRA